MDGSAYGGLPAYTSQMEFSLQSLAVGRNCCGLLLAASLLAGMVGGMLSHGSAVEPNRVSLTVVDGSGEPLEGAIVWALPVSDQAMPATGTMTTAIEQRGKAFIPAVTPVRVGTAVSFPNLDTVRHHVYSFSPAKVFSLKLYLGTPAEPVVFDKPGEVVLGCNIHDGMLAYVMALETPYFGKTGGEGQAVLSDLIPGDYELRAWHPKQRAAPIARRVTIQASGRLSHQFIADIGRQTTAGT